MNTTAKPTPGPYFLADDKAEDCPDHKDSGLALIDTGRFSDFPIARLMEWNNAKFLHEALTVYHETGLTPRQLVDQLEVQVKKTDTLMDEADVLADQLSVSRAECETVHTNLILADAERKALADQRAELMAALDELLAVIPWHMYEPMVKQANVAIARAKAVPK